MSRSILLKEVRLGSVLYGDVDVKVSRYQAGHGVALAMFDPESGEMITVITVNLPDHPPAPGAFWVKSWGENDGMLLLLGKAGLVEYTGVVQRTGFVEAVEAKSKGALKDLIQEEVKSWSV